MDACGRERSVERDHGFVELAGVVGVTGDGVLAGRGVFLPRRPIISKFRVEESCRAIWFKRSGGGVAQRYACLGFHRLLARG